MQVKIKCLECNRRTMHQEVGRVFYNPNNLMEILFEREVFCNKCGLNISSRKVEVDHYLFMTLLAANISKQIHLEDGAEIPEHLRGVYCLNEKSMKEAREFCRTIPVIKKCD